MNLFYQTLILVLLRICLRNIKILKHIDDIIADLQLGFSAVK